MSLKKLSLILALFEIIVIYSHAVSKKTFPELKFKISGRNFSFSSENEKAIYEDTGRYIPWNILATRMQLHRQKLIIALPRYMPGVPATLARADLLLKNSQPTLRAFPNWKMQQIGNCDSFQSVVDIFIDQKHVLWILDAGTVSSLNNPVKKCAPKVISYCLKKMKLLQLLDLSHFVSSWSSLQYVVVDNAADGKDYVYVSDAGGKSILAINSNDGMGRILNLPSVVTAEGVCNNALYLAMLRYQGVNHLYFTYLDCEGVFSVPTRALTDVKGGTLIRLVGIKSHPVVFCGTDGNAILYYRLKDNNDIYSWDVNTPFSPDRNAVVRKGEDGRITTHITRGPGGLPWLMETDVKGHVGNCTGCIVSSTEIFPVMELFNKH